MKNKPFFAAALAAFLAMAVFSCGARAAQQPEYVEGEAIVVMKPFPALNRPPREKA